MKKIVCPRCDNFVTFDETRYTEGQSLRFHCPHCGRKFGIKLTKKLSSQEIIGYGTQTPDENLGRVDVLENQFGTKQSYPLILGDNIIGRRSKGTVVQIPILTGDMSLDRQHCVVNVKRDKNGKLIYTIRDFPSLVGTFLQHEIIAKGQRIVLHEDAIVTLGATTIIVRLADESTEAE